MKNNATHSSTEPSRSSTGERPAQSARQRPPEPRAKERFRTEQSAGGVIYRRRNGQVEIFFIKDPYGRWTFPKGHQELGETMVQTAQREIQEETGLDGLRFIAPLGRTTFRFKRGNTLVQKGVLLFLFEAPADAKEKLTGEDAIWEATWVRPHQAFGISGYRNLDRLLSKALRIIAQDERQRRSRRIGHTIMTALLVIGFLFAAGRVQAATSLASDVAQPLILQMADGSFYNPASGQKAATRDGLLVALGYPATSETTTTSPVIEISTGAPAATSSAFTVDFPLKTAIQRARVILREEIDKDTSSRLINSDNGWRQVSLAIWNKDTDEIYVRHGLKNGTQLKLEGTGDKVVVNVANGLNSAFSVRNQSSHVIVAIRYPLYTDVKVSGKKRVKIEDVIYTPYSEALHTPEMVAWGKFVLSIYVTDAYLDLNQLGVKSRAYPGRLLTQVVDQDVVKAVAVIEHSDDAAFVRDSQKALDRVMVTIAANEQNAYAYSKSSAGALGISQFMPKTYAGLVKRADLKLITDFTKGSRTPTNALKATAAYIDQMVAELPADVRADCATDTYRLFEYAVAAYNTGAPRVKRAIAAWGDQWDEPGADALVKARARHRELRLGMVDLKAKIKAETSAKTKKTMKAKLAVMQDEYLKNEDMQDLLTKSRLKRQTIDYLFKFRQAMALEQANGSLASL